MAIPDSVVIARVRLQPATTEHEERQHSSEDTNVAPLLPDLAQEIVVANKRTSNDGREQNSGNNGGKPPPVKFTEGRTYRDVRRIDFNQRLKMGDEVVITCGRQLMLYGTVETRFPNLRRRLTIRYTAANGTTGIDRTCGTLPGPAEYVGTQYEIKVLRVVGKMRVMPL